MSAYSFPAFLLEPTKRLVPFAQSVYGREPEVILSWDDSRKRYTFEPSYKDFGDPVERWTVKGPLDSDVEDFLRQEQEQKSFKDWSNWSQNIWKLWLSLSYEEQGRAKESEQRWRESVMHRFAAFGSERTNMTYVPLDSPSPTSKHAATSSPQEPPNSDPRPPFRSSSQRESTSSPKSYGQRPRRASVSSHIHPKFDRNTPSARSPPRQPEEYLDRRGFADAGPSNSHASRHQQHSNGSRKFARSASANTDYRSQIHEIPSTSAFLPMSSRGIRNRVPQAGREDAKSSRAGNPPVHHSDFTRGTGWRSSSLHPPLGYYDNIAPPRGIPLPRLPRPNEYTPVDTHLIPHRKYRLLRHPTGDIGIRGKAESRGPSPEPRARPTYSSSGAEQVFDAAYRPYIVKEEEGKEQLRGRGKFRYW